jgi:hypothetical protein
MLCFGNTIKLKKRGFLTTEFYGVSQIEYGMDSIFINILSVIPWLIFQYLPPPSACPPEPLGRRRVICHSPQFPYCKIVINVVCLNN